jgi:hypothetical protein
MPGNELVLVDQAISEEQQNRDAPLPDDKAFEYFACEQVLQDYELSQEELEYGLIGGSQDGALDGIFAFLGDLLLTEDSELVSDDSVPTKYERGLKLSLELVQAKRQTSFTETAIDVVSSSLGRLLDMNEEDADLLLLYSPEVVQRMRMFKTAWQRLSTSRPTLSVKFSYVTRGDTSNVNPRVKLKADDLERQLAKLVPGADIHVALWGAAELWEASSRAPSYTLRLPFLENATKGESHVAIVRLQDYYDFITDAAGNLRRHIFDANVRDFQGDIAVNQQIRASLENPAAPEFWWMNNGVTVVCSAAQIVGKEYTLDDVQVVNGLQTSYTIYDVIRAKRQRKETGSDIKSVDDRAILLKILVTQDPATRDEVIRATNRQTSVPVASLHATEEIQRKIEAYFRINEWYYDRRKNYYRNVGQPTARIISIPFLAQAIMAIGLSEPNNSRARPSSLLNREDDYRRVFSDEIPLQTYLWLARVQRHADSLLAAAERVELTAYERTNLRFHVSMLVVARAYGAPLYSPKQLTGQAESGSMPSDEKIIQALWDLKLRAKDFADERGWELDRIAKSRDFVTYVLSREFPVNLRKT